MPPFSNWIIPIRPEHCRRVRSYCALKGRTHVKMLLRPPALAYIERISEFLIVIDSSSCDSLSPVFTLTQSLNIKKRNLISFSDSGTSAILSPYYKSEKTLLKHATPGVSLPAYDYLLHSNTCQVIGYKD
jgi:hypothetical protein